MARRKKKADPKPEPIEVPAEDPKAEPEVDDEMIPAGIQVVTDVLEPEPPPDPEKPKRYFLSINKRAKCARNRILIPGDEVFQRDFPGVDLDDYVEQGILEKRWV